MQNPVLYIPLRTFVLSLYFGTAVYRRFREKTSSGEPPGTHLLW